MWEREGMGERSLRIQCRCKQKWLCNQVRNIIETRVFVPRSYLRKIRESSMIHVNTGSSFEGKIARGYPSTCKNDISAHSLCCWKLLSANVELQWEHIQRSKVCICFDFAKIFHRSFSPCEENRKTRKAKKPWIGQNSLSNSIKPKVEHDFPTLKRIGEAQPARRLQLTQT